jgi:hypothetical protein
MSGLGGRSFHESGLKQAIRRKCPRTMMMMMMMMVLLLVAVVVQTVEAALEAGKKKTSWEALRGLDKKNWAGRGEVVSPWMMCNSKDDAGDDRKRTMVVVVVVEGLIPDGPNDEKGSLDTLLRIELIKYGELVQVRGWWRRQWD